MDRAFSSGASGTPPTAPVSPSVGYATSGNPATATPATKPGPWWYHMMTEEVRKVITDAGLTPDQTNLSQLSQAIQLLIAAGVANDYKASVRAATTANITTLAGGAPNTLDGVTLVLGDRILVKDQSTGSQSGLYSVTTLGTGVNGTWTRTTDADGAGELTSGAVVSVEEGSTNADSQWQLTTDGAITIGTTALVFTRIGGTSGSSIQGAFKNLQASATGLSATVTVTADEIVLENSSNSYTVQRNVSLSISGASSGVANGLDTGALAINTWYSVWVIWNGTTQAGLLSLSTTAPALPSGYTHKARVGWIRTDSSGNKYPLGFTQRGKSVVWLIGSGNLATPMQMSSGAVGVASGSSYTGVAVAWTNYAPPTAAKIRIGLTSTSSALLCASANPNRSGAASVNPPELGYSYASFPAFTYGDLMIESPNIYWASSAVSGYLLSGGWEDNL